MHQFASYFSQKEIERVHEASRGIGKYGMYVQTMREPGRFCQGRLSVDNQTTLVKFPQKLLKSAGNLLYRNINSLQDPDFDITRQMTDLSLSQAVQRRI